jgi:hypothetical protein
VFAWLFRKRLTRERAIAIATQFLADHGCCVVPTEAAADFSGDDIPVVFRSASIPGRRWFVEFERVFPAGLYCSHPDMTVFVWADTGRATFDPFDGWDGSSCGIGGAAPG